MEEGVEFEFDPVKSSSNKRKHGIDFIEAQELWKDDNAFVIEARSEEETRHFLFARLDETPLDRHFHPPKPKNPNHIGKEIAR